MASGQAGVGSPDRPPSVSGIRTSRARPGAGPARGGEGSPVPEAGGAWRARGCRRPGRGDRPATPLCHLLPAPVPQGGLDPDEIVPGEFGVEDVTLGVPVRPSPPRARLPKLGRPHGARQGRNRTGPAGLCCSHPGLRVPKLPAMGAAVCHVRAAPCGVQGPQIRRRRPRVLRLPPPAGLKWSPDFTFR